MSEGMQTVLLVDDEEFFLRSMVDGFAAHRGKVRLLTAANGKAALRVLERASVDLVVTDLKMPEMDGFELVAELSRSRPELPVIIMTAFGTPEIEKRLRACGITNYVDKPIDFQALSKKVFDALADSASGHLRGISLSTLLQMVELDRKTCVVNVEADGRRGALVFRSGELLDAAVGTRRGDEAALEILGWDEGAIDLRPATAQRTRVVTHPLSELLMESFRLRDERDRKVATHPQANGAPVFTPLDPLSTEDPTNTRVTNQESVIMSAMDKLKELSSVEGFSGAAVFTATGEVLAALAGDVSNIKEVGVLVNAVLLNAQKSSLEMGTGRGQQVHIEAERAHLLARCLNEGTDPIRSQPGKAHIHVVLVLKVDASLGLAKMRLNSVCDKLAEDFRS